MDGLGLGNPKPAAQAQATPPNCLAWLASEFPLHPTLPNVCPPVLKNGWPSDWAVDNREHGKNTRSATLDPPQRMCVSCMSCQHMSDLRNLQPLGMASNLQGHGLQALSLLTSSTHFPILRPTGRLPTSLRPRGGNEPRTKSATKKGSQTAWCWTEWLGLVVPGFPQTSRCFFPPILRPDATATATPLHMV